MCVEVLPLRFEFIARDPVRFPPGKAANTLRGALGFILDSDVFAPVAGKRGPSGLADYPRPFVFRARHLDGRTFQPGETFAFDVHVFTLEPRILESLERSFAAVSQAGLGTNRGKAEMRRLVPVERISVDLTAAVSAPGRIRVEFLSPTELKNNDRIADQPEFPILFGRIRDRISTLRALYGPGPLDIDFRALALRAAEVRMTDCALANIENQRRSSRTGQRHSIGGFTGSADYEGDLAEFFPYLKAAGWTGVGRHTVWGNGEIRLKLI